jgi:hypothetical protein
LWRDIPAGRQADRKFTLPSRFAIYKDRVKTDPHGPFYYPGF